MIITITDAKIRVYDLSIAMNNAQREIQELNQFINNAQQAPLPTEAPVA